MNNKAFSFSFLFLWLRKSRWLPRRCPSHETELIHTTTQKYVYYVRFILTYPCSSLRENEILRLCPSTWRAVRMSAHCTISPRGPPFSTLGLKTSPDSSVRKPTWTRIWMQEEEEESQRTAAQCFVNVMHAVFQLCYSHQFWLFYSDKLQYCMGNKREFVKAIFLDISTNSHIHVFRY